MKIAVIQMNVIEGEVEYNFTHMKELLLKAACHRPDVIVLPETWNTGFFPKQDMYELADKNGERAKSLLQYVSSTYNVNIVGGSVTEERDGKIFNTCYVYDRSGENIASYSKMHLFSPMKENEYYTPGNEFCLFSVDGICCAVIICYDLRFPELTRRLALSGAEVLFVPSQWPSSRISQMKILLSARAVENQMYVVSCNAAGNAYGTEFAGLSLVCDPSGNTLAASEKEEILYVDAEMQKIHEIRKSVDVFSDRRSDMY